MRQSYGLSIISEDDSLIIAMVLKDNLDANFVLSFLVTFHR